MPQRVQPAVKAYCDLHSLSLFDISELEDIQQHYLQNKAFTFQNDPGCYLFWSATRELLYIGKASGKHKIVGRIYSYFRWNAGRTAVAPPSNHSWTSPPVYLQTIKVDIPYQAPSLEKYLIGELHPSHNTFGRRKLAPPP